MFIFPYFSLTMGIHFSHVLGIVWISASLKIFEKPITLECLFFPCTFSGLWKFTFPKFWELYGFLLHPKCLRNPQIWIVCVFPYLSHIMEIHFSHVLGTARISASSEKFQKHLTLKCLCFLIFFPYYGNSLFPYFGNCMNFCFTQNIWETLECLFFSPYFSRIHILGVECINTTHEVCKKPIALKCLCFPILFSLTTRIQLFSMFLELYGFLVD